MHISDEYFPVNPSFARSQTLTDCGSLFPEIFMVGGGFSVLMLAY